MVIYNNRKNNKKKGRKYLILILNTSKPERDILSLFEMTRE